MGEAIRKGAFNEGEAQDGPIRVAVVGATSPFGLEAFRSLSQWTEIEFVLAVDQNEVGKSVRSLAGGRALDLVIEDKLGVGLDREKCDVLVDFSHSSAALQHGVSALKRGVAAILNTSLSAPEIRELHAECGESKAPALIAPNLSIGEVLLLKLCYQAARWMPDFEVIDVQHEGRQDSPCAFARALAEALSDGWEQRELLATGGIDYGRSRTWEDVRMHIIRLRGASPSHEVRFSTFGESFSIHISPREPSAIIDGLKLAISRVRSLQGVVVGLEKLLQ